MNFQSRFFYNPVVYCLVIMALTKNLLSNKNVHIIGIKGTGCAALVGILLQQNCRITGSDGPDFYFTCTLLDSLNVTYHQQFSADNIPADTDLVIHSAAYSEHNNIEMKEAQRRNLPIYSYPQALGQLSAAYYSLAVAGVHGKTTTSALCGVIAKTMNEHYQLGANILVGSAVPNFDDQAVLLSPEGDIFIAETCEYRRHFLHFHPKVILLTSIEWDHQDYFITPDDVHAAFMELCEKLPQGGTLICCVDDKGVQTLLKTLAPKRPDVQIIPYGFSAHGSKYQILSANVRRIQDSVMQECRIAGWNHPFHLQIPGRHNTLNATAALAVCEHLMQQKNPSISMQEWMPKAMQALTEFRGTKRRAEIIGHERDILIMDDYGHHPTAMTTTLAGIKDFFQPKRLVVSFMSHTYSRTAAQIDEFAQSLNEADILILHKIYASAREVFNGNIDGRTLFEKCQNLQPNRPTYYVEEPLEALPLLENILQPGDLFLTLGAGSNFHLSHALFREWLS